MRLSDERRRKEMSRAEVARRARIGATDYGLVERGRLVPYDIWKVRIAEALEWPVEQADELFEEVPTS